MRGPLTVAGLRSGLLGGVCALLLVSARAAPVRLCAAESAALPERHWAEQGLPVPPVRQVDVFLTHLLAQKASVDLDIEVLPWRRCLTEVRAGRLDGVLGLSHTAERAGWAAFPLKGATLDESLRVRGDAYHWYVRKPEPWSWDGRVLNGPRPPRVAAISGYSVVEVLRAQGFRVEEQVQSSLSALRMLAMGRIDAAALLHTEADPLLAVDAGLASAVLRLDPPVTERSYYLAFGLLFARAQQGVVSKLWRVLPLVRDSAPWKAATADAHARSQL